MHKVTGDARTPKWLSIFPPPQLPMKACGPIVQDGAGYVIANCPNSQVADFVAWSINAHNGVHD